MTGGEVVEFKFFSLNLLNCVFCNNSNNILIVIIF